MVFIKVDTWKDSFTSWSNGLVEYWFGETWKILRTSSCPTLVGILQHNVGGEQTVSYMLAKSFAQKLDSNLIQILEKGKLFVQKLLTPS
jgi:hypothetical protein